MVASTKRIHAEMFVEELVNEYPKAVGILMEEGIVCIQCGEPVWGTLGDTIERKCIKDVDRIIEKLNKYLA